MAEPPPPGPRRAPSDAQTAWLRRGLDQPGGKLPLFDELGQRVRAQTIRSCIDNGWAERWFSNPLKPDWLVCRLTEAGRQVVAERSTVIEVDFGRAADRGTTG